MSLFEFKIWDKKKLDVINDDGELVQVPHPKETGWVKRAFDLETDQLRITSFQEYELYGDDEISFRNCVQVFLSDDDYVYAAYTIAAWKKLYTDTYLPLIPPSLSDIVDDLKGE